MVVVCCGVSHDGVIHAVSGGVVVLDVCEEVAVAFVLLLLLIGEAVVSHVLHLPCACRCREGVCHGSLCRHLSPLCGGVGVAAIDGHSALVEFLPVAQDVFADVSEVDIQVGSHAVGVADAVLSGYEGVEHPEFQILYVCVLEVREVEFAHHSAPSFLREGEPSFCVEFCREVVGSALLRVEGEIENGQCVCRSAVAALVAVGVELADIHLAHIMVRQLVEVALYVCRSE